MLIIGRAVAGMGGSGIQNGAFTIVAGSVPMPRRPGMLKTQLCYIMASDKILALMGFLMGSKYCTFYGIRRPQLTPDSFTIRYGCWSVGGRRIDIVCLMAVV